MNSFSTNNNQQNFFNSNLNLNKQDLKTRINNLGSKSSLLADQTASIISQGIRDNHSRDYMAAQVLHQIDPELAKDSAAINQARQVLIDPVVNQEQQKNKQQIGGTSTTITRTITNPNPERQLNDPGVDNSHQNLFNRGFYSYRDVAGEQLYIDGISADDVQQGQVGDCYFVASLASIAEANPDVIRNAITDNGDGTYTVRFGTPNSPNNIVTVDDDFLQDRNGNLIYGSSTQQGELWVAIMEKAYTTSFGNNSYQNINGGFSAVAMHQILGSGAQVYPTNLGRRNVRQVIENALEQNRPIVAATGRSNQRLTDRGLAGPHAYSVLGIERRGFNTSVILRNPWGQGEWNGRRSDNTDDGTFRMPLNAFVDYFQRVSIGGSLPNPTNNP